MLQSRLHLNIGLFCLSLLLFILNGCEKETGYVAIENELFIKAKEVFYYGERQFSLEVSVPTVGTKPYFVDFDFKKTENNIALNLKRLYFYDSDVEFTEPPNPYTLVNFGELDFGNYSFLVEINKRSYFGSIEVGSNSYSINLPSDENLSLDYSVLQRIPESCVWGDFSYLDTIDLNLFDQLEQDLYSIGGQNLSLVSGNYGYFSVDGAGNLIADQSNCTTEPCQHLSLVYGFDLLNLDAMEALIETYNSFDALEITLYTTDGLMFQTKP